MDRIAGNNCGAKKKVKPSERPKTGALFMLRCAELGLSDETLETMSMGMVYDMLIEQANDGADYATIAPPGSLRDFFLGGGKIAE